MKKLRLFRLFFLIAGILCLVAVLVLSIIFTFTVANAISLIAGISFLGLYWIYPELTKRWRKFVTGSLIVLGIYMVCMFFFIGIQGAKNTTAFNEDCVLVLGCGILGETVLSTLQFRLDKCIDYLQYNPKALIIVSGGQGRGEMITESEAMKRYLISQGVNVDQIIEESQSKNTRQNMQFSKVLLDSLFLSGNYSVVCITSDYHAFRANKLSQKADLSVSHYNAKTAWYLYPSAYCRETFSIIKMWIGL